MRRRATGELRDFKSRIDGKLHPYAVCVAGDSNEPLPVIVEVSPGAITNLPAAVETTERLANMALEAGESCIVLRPTGCGPGSLYQNYGEVDLFESIDAISDDYDIDRNRISITGASMGGAATWYLISHYPDFFSAAAPFCGYCDYRLWPKLGGTTFPRMPWEETSWKSRSAMLLAENLEHTPQWIVHGEWDRAVGGGVPVEHSRNMTRLLESMDYPVRYTELPNTAHDGCLDEQTLLQIVPWLLSHTKEREPDHVALTTYGLRHNSSYWLSIDQIERYGERAFVDAGISEGQLRIKTRNVKSITIGPLPRPEDIGVTVDGQSLGSLSNGIGTVNKDFRNTWSNDGSGVCKGKHAGCSGPISDLFFDPTIFVPGTQGTDEETYFNKWLAQHHADRFRQQNGGLHRGGIPGENNVEMHVITDTEISDGELGENNIVLVGTGSTNAVLDRFQDDIPISFGHSSVSLGDKTYTSEDVAAFAVCPNPYNSSRYVGVHGGTSPDAITWGSQLGLMLLPDYIVYSGTKPLDWGFFDSNWRIDDKGSGLG